MQMKSMLIRQAKLLIVLVASLCMSYLSTAAAGSEDVVGYFTSETNECPEALKNMQKTGKWSGVIITPVQISYSDGKVCSLSNENMKSNVLYMTLMCPNDPKQSGEYGFSIHDNELVITRKSERQSYVRCRNLNLSTVSDLPTKRNQSSGLNVGGANLRPFGNNNSMGMRMNAPF